ncbi:hypothetical protein J7T55_005813 [Diaporthe amygdali]|uniref:uncharacterized protein n=1 Tax=Phomopsis amygdali TaxID=1214568 RepID=UPI0022FDD95F|nr:uncharacterized protein J7T55_005813 [Diaporthe amygdali]KAJ0124475.1 hypothetical protein J7T55_005813 [Diaporthe amygdali]
MATPRDAINIGTTLDYQTIVASWSPEERAAREKTLKRKIDLRLLPILSLMYILNYIDRNALPQAKVQGISEDIGLAGIEYNVVLSLTFIGYILMQGIAEAPFFAGVAFLFSGWYTRSELGFRLGLFFCAAMISGAFGGLFAAGIAAAFKNNKIPSWRWLFIIEGAATVVCAMATTFIIPDWPATTKWLTEEEKALGVVRLIEDAGDEESEIRTFDALKMAVKDHLKDFGYSNINTLLLTAPPYVFTALFSLFNTWHSDKTSNRSPYIVYPTLVAMSGIIITLATTNIGARYFALFLMLPGTYGGFQISNAWVANIAARPQKKRAISLAMSNSIGNLALVWTPYLYPDSDGPRYTTAWSVNLGLSVVTLTSVLFLSFILIRDNKTIHDLELLGFNLERADGQQKQQVISRHNEHPTVGRPNGGAISGGLTRYQT